MGKIQHTTSFSMSPERLWASLFDSEFQARLDLSRGVVKREPAWNSILSPTFSNVTKLYLQREFPPQLRKLLLMGCSTLETLIKANLPPQFAPPDFQKMLDWQLKRGRPLITTLHTSDALESCAIELEVLEALEVEANHGCIRWCVVFELFEPLATCKGSTSVVAQGDGSACILEGVVAVQIPGIGTHLESFLEKELINLLGWQEPPPTIITPQLTR